MNNLGICCLFTLGNTLDDEGFHCGIVVYIIKDGWLPIDRIVEEVYNLNRMLWLMCFQCFYECSHLVCAFHAFGDAIDFEGVWVEAEPHKRSWVVAVT